MGYHSFGIIIGFLAIPFVIYLVAVLLAKKYKVVSWILFAVGTGLSALSLIGQQRQIGSIGLLYSGLKSLQTTKILTFLVLSVAALTLIATRASAGADEASDQSTDETQNGPEV